MRDYQGIVIEESLTDNRILNGLELMKFWITGHENPTDRWHQYTIKVSQEEIEKISDNIKDGWYAHFWKDQNVIAIFKGRRFEFDYDDKSTWEPVLEYGLSLGIPEKQLDFPIE